MAQRSRLCGMFILSIVITIGFTVSSGYEIGNQEPVPGKDLLPAATAAQKHAVARLPADPAAGTSLNNIERRFGSTRDPAAAHHPALPAPNTRSAEEPSDDNLLTSIAVDIPGWVERTEEQRASRSLAKIIPDGGDEPLWFISDVSWAAIVAGDQLEPTSWSR